MSFDVNLTPIPVINVRDLSSGNGSISGNDFKTNLLENSIKINIPFEESRSLNEC